MTDEASEAGEWRRRQASGEARSFYDEAVRIVTESRRASISLVQRRLRIGYNRAARMMEEMEAAGVVSSMDNSGSREVLAAAPANGLIQLSRGYVNIAITHRNHVLALYFALSTGLCVSRSRS